MQNKRAVIILIIMVSMVLLWNLGAKAQEEQNEKFVYDDHEKRDPLWPLVNGSGVILNYDKDLMVADMVLDGIMVGNAGSNVAIINGLIVNVNDKIGLFIVNAINPDSVILQKGDETVTLKLKKEE